ncbi:MAG: CoA pyrophosphatase [Gemmatimonadales bacterium]|nr:CoA pyrophosphatase [Gemmatimonadales bacterium]MDZ4389964.1 CoA pyrophosphatase [Gemmatimonadales bacterium]
MSELRSLLARLAQRPAQQVDDPGRPQAGVAVLLAPDPVRLLLIRRAERVGDPWSGQLALPGGRHEVGDADLLATALRETHEEVGLEVSRAAHRATLDDLAPVIPVLPPILVRPFVFEVDDLTIPQVSNEVAAVGWVELDRLIVPDSYRSTTIEVRGAPREVQGYHLDEGLLWGMTERILDPLISAWRTLRR